MKKIAIDVDGVILDTITSFCNIYNEIYGGSKSFVKKTKNDCKRWDFWEDWKLSSETFWFIFSEVRKIEREIPITYKHISKYMLKLNKNNIVDIITGRGTSKELNESLISKLKKHRIIQGLHYNEIHYVEPNNNDKLEFGYDIYLDDNPKMASKLKIFNRKRPLEERQVLFLYDQPWNRHIGDSNGVYRVKDWKDFWSRVGVFL